MYEAFKPFSWSDEQYYSKWMKPGHCFCRVQSFELLIVERIIGLRIPESLRCFYEEIGFGAISRSDTEDTDEADCFVVSPWALAELYLKSHPNWQATEVDNAYRRFISGEPESPLWHLADDGEMPFIHLGQRFYWVLRPLSENPNAVYLQRGGDLVSDDFAKLALILKDDPLYGWVSPLGG